MRELPVDRFQRLVDGNVAPYRRMGGHGLLNGGGRCPMQAYIAFQSTRPINRSQNLRPVILVKSITVDREASGMGAKARQGFNSRNRRLGRRLR